MKLELARRAVAQAERCTRWWRENRSSSPGLFDEELRAALDQIRTTPLLGSVYEVVRGQEHRRLLMPRTRYHVYYRIVAADVVRIVAVWSAARGRGPHL